LGEAPAEKPIPCDTHPTTHFFGTDTNRGLADTLIYISKGLSVSTPVRLQLTNELVFTNCQIQPFVSAVVGPARMVIRDAEGTTHYLRVTSAEGKSDHPAHVRPDHSATFPLLGRQSFTTVACEIHPYEFAFVSILDNPFFAITGSDGGFALTNVPPGNYTVTALHRRPGATRAVSKSVQVRAGEITPIDFTFEESAPKQLSSR
jgi:hypothetical protein